MDIFLWFLQSWNHTFYFIIGFCHFAFLVNKYSYVIHWNGYMIFYHIYQPQFKQIHINIGPNFAFAFF